MLQRLYIKNIALIEALELTFGPGFHVLTGETGAGKSIIIDAINFVLGERANRDLIKTGERKAAVEAEFDIANLPEVYASLEDIGIVLEEDEPLILARELTINGKNICRINGTLVTLGALKSITDLLVDVHGQHEHQSLLEPSRHIAYLDAFGMQQIAPIKEALQGRYYQLSEVSKKLTAGFPSEQERLRRLDMLQYQLDEIDRAELRKGEEEALIAQHTLLSNAQSILSALEQSYALLAGEEGSALIQTGSAVHAMEAISNMHEDYAAALSRLQEAYYSLEDVAFSLRDFKSNFEFQPGLLENVEARLDCIHTLKHKYGDTVDGILEFRDTIAKELDELQQSDAIRAKLQKEKAALQHAYDVLAADLTKARKSAALVLQNQLLAQLKDLGLEKSQFSVDISPLPGQQWGMMGKDRVEFLLSTNAGEPLKPLSRVASGGELSRIMLAFKTVAADLGGIPTLIFDEIDTGISGHIATVVGKKMLHIAQMHQVLCITHLPQIAAMANIHFFVEKLEADGRTYTTVKVLDMQQRCRELARIMGANDTDVHAMEHARELLSNAQKL